MRRAPRGPSLLRERRREARLRHRAQPATSTNSDLWVVPIDGPPEALASPRNITASNRAFDGAPRYSPDGRSIAYRTQRVPAFESDRPVLAIYDRASGTSRVLTESLDAWVNAFRLAPDGKRLYFTADWNGKVMQDVTAVSDWLAAQPWVDKDRMGAMGWSWGGYAMMWLAGHTERYKAIASMMGVYDLRSMYSSTEELWFPEWDLGGAPWQNPRATASRARRPTSRSSRRRRWSSRARRTSACPTPSRSPSSRTCRRWASPRASWCSKAKP